MGNLVRDVLFRMPAQDYTFCLLIVRYMLSDKIKGESALKARTFLPVERDKVHACYWYKLCYLQLVQIFLKPFIGETFTSDPINMGPSFYLQEASHQQWSLTWISFVNILSQT